jgi:hypothetical protein
LKTPHTPAPWKVSRVEAVKTTYIQTSSGYIIAQVADSHSHSEKHEGNARLIAAAPALLEALEGLLQWADEYERAGGPDVTERWRIRARDAIKQAKPQI